MKAVSNFQTNMMESSNYSDKMLILVVEDDDISYFLVREILSSLGLESIRAKTKNETLQIISEHKDLRLMILDIMLMGSENGYVIASELASKQVDLPIVVVSAWDVSVLNPKPTINKNIIAVMEKPLNIGDFKKNMIEVLELGV